MASRNKVKITVLRRFSPSEVMEKSPATTVRPIGACERFADGQVFVVGEDCRMPEGFCTTAWNDIFGNVRTLAFGGSFPWLKDKGIGITCCTDGLRPVILKLERV